MSTDVIGIGSLNFDRIYHVEKLAKGDEQVVIRTAIDAPGGSSANSIVGLAKLGISTGFVGAVGPDPRGEQILSEMDLAGIDMAHVKTIPELPTAEVFVFVDSTGERAMYSKPGASAELKINDHDIEWLKDSKYTVISAIPGEDQLPQLNRVIASIHNNTRIIFMPGALYVNQGFAGLQDIINKSYLLILNRREIKKLTDLEYIPGSRYLLEKGCNMVAVTLGEDGCYICSGDNSWHIPSPVLAKDRIIDSTGAGDAFTTGLVYGLLNTKPIPEAALLGILSARACIQALGARAGLLERAGLEHEFDSYSKVIENE